MTAEIGLTADSRWEIGTEALIEAAKEAGFSTLGVAASRAGPDAVAACARSDIRCHEVLALSIGGDPALTLSRAQQLAEAAALLGARWVLTVFANGLNTETVPLIRRCAALFAEAGAGMAVEFSPLGPVGSIREGLEVVDVAGAQRAGVMIDTWHFCFGDSTWSDLRRVPLEKIAYVQFDDALAPCSDDLFNETMNRRTMPGEGVLDLERFSTTLLERGWEGVVSVEVLSEELRALPIPAFMRRAYEATRRYWH